MNVGQAYLKVVSKPIVIFVMLFTRVISTFIKLFFKPFFQRYTKFELHGLVLFNFYANFSLSLLFILIIFRCVVNILYINNFILHRAVY